MELRLQIKTIEKELLAWHRTTQESRRLKTIPGVGFITATAIAATVTDPSHFRSSREFSAWLGLTPRQKSSGGKDRLGRISKMGDGYLRSLIVVGATAMIRYAREKGPVTPDGSTRCWRRNQPVSSRLPSPTRRRGSPGRCSSGRKIIGFRCLLLHERPVQTRHRIEKFFSLGRVIMA